jgi:formylmethanofuran dehydrogenase subunit D
MVDMSAPFCGNVRFNKAYTGRLALAMMTHIVIQDDFARRTRRGMMFSKRFIMNAGRTSKQGQQINVGKDHAEYQAIVSTLTRHAEDMKALNIPSGATVRVRSEYGEAVFQCKEGKVPAGMVFVPYGPPTCRLMGGGTDGTGMPTSKNWEVEIEPITGERPA